MGLYDRDYTQSDYHSSHGYHPQMRMMFPRMTPVVKWLMIINISIFVLTVLSDRLANFAFTWFSVFPATVGMSLQLWRIITYQFLHDIHSMGHIFVNMVVLYFFGVMLERSWGSRRFLTFYLICGAMGGILYPILALVGWLAIGPLVGASGGILGMIAACAIMYPNMRVLVFFVFPVRLFIVALVIAGWAVLTLLRPTLGNAGGEAAHLAGMAAGAIYVLSQSWRARLMYKMQSRSVQRKTQTYHSLQQQIDDILDKVHREGIGNLTRQERKILKQATEIERKRNML